MKRCLAILDEEYEPGVPGRACPACNCGWPASEPDDSWWHHERGCPNGMRAESATEEKRRDNYPELPEVSS